MTRPSDATPRMTLPRALLSEALRLVRSPLTAVHLVCGLAAGLACGEYFSVTRWDPALGADAYAQFLGALMPLMSAIVCGLAVDEERAAGRLANLTAVPSRGRAVAAKLLALAALGAGALAVALGVFGAMRTSLAESLEARWAAERGQREQVASLAHDLKTPLTVLRANADFVAEELEDEKDADLAAAARDIAGSVERLDGYVRLLIEASRGSGGAERAPMRPAELCEQVLAEAAQIARARGVTLDATTGPAVAGAPEAPLDRTALARAAANLVANAAEHARSRVAVSCDVESGHLVIEVADDGPGFSPAALERGCERLFTDDSSRSSRDGGRHYGLGLHAAAEAASAHGGSVSLANSPSGGAVATIAVPLCGA